MDFRNQCPLCNSNEYEILENKSITDNKLSSFLERNYKLGEYLKDINYFYELRFCSKCGTRYQVNFLNEEETNKLYSNSIKPQKAFETGSALQ